MSVNDLVYRAGRNGTVWHWRLDVAYGPVSQCSAWPLNGASKPAVSVRMEDRCAAKGCAVRWNRWVAATIHTALVDAVNRNAA